MKLNPDKMWKQIYQTIIEVYRSQEKHFIKATSHYPHKEAFFEMVRFDFVIDDELKVYLMEANMSPNLSSQHFSANAGLYEEVVDALLRLVGVVGVAQHGQLEAVQEKDVLVSPDVCSADCSCTEERCKLCRPCLSALDLNILTAAWRE